MHRGFSDSELIQQTLSNVISTTNTLLFANKIEFQQLK